MDHLVALKNEQTARIVVRETSLYVFIATVFAVYAAQGQAGNNHALVSNIQSLSGALSAIMFSIYLSNDYYVTRIGRFVRETKPETEFSKWERDHPKGIIHVLQKALRLGIVVVLFAGWPTWQWLLSASDAWTLDRTVGATGLAVTYVELIAFFFLNFLKR